MELGIADPTNITGMGSLIDLKGVAAEFDPHALEREIIRGLNGATPTPGGVKQSIAEEFARDIGSIAPPVKTVRFETPKPTSADPFGMLELDNKHPVADDMDDLMKLLDAPTPNPSHPLQHVAVDTSTTSRLGQLTHEEQRQRIIHQAYGTPTSTTPTMFSIEKDRDDDEKSRDLEQIASLLEILQDEGDDISKIPKVTHTHSKVEIKTVLRYLELKNDRKRCGSFAEEIILMGVHGIEWLFDGKKHYFGHTPDMTDWHKTVATKLRRNRHNTSELVASFMQEVGLGAGSRLLLELLPSAFLYSRMRRSTTGQVSDDEFSAATNRMRDYETAGPAAR